MSELALNEFQLEFPEFEDAPVELVTARLAMAHRAYSEDVLGAVYLDAVRYKTAVLLSDSPFGRSLRLDKGNGLSIYAETLADILAGAPSRIVVIDGRA